MDERVVIRIEVNADTSAIDRVQAKLAALSSQAKLADGNLGGASDKLTDLSGASTDASRSTDKLSKSMRGANRDSDRLSKKVNQTSRMFEMHRKVVGGVTSMLSKGLKFALLGTVLEFGLMAAALSSVNGLLAVGRATMKAFNWMMSGTAALAAAATAALATVAAAQREYNAAMVQFQYKSAPGLGNGTAQAMSAMRMLTSDTKLASFGMEALNQTFASISKNTEVTAPLKGALKGLGDFAVAAGGDIGKNLAAAGEFLGLLQKEGKLTAEVAQAAGAVGPQFQKAIENAQKMGLTGASELMKAFSSGTFAETAGIAGSLDAVNDTLIGRAKAFFTSVVSMFADLGQAFLPDVKVAFDKLTRIFRVTFARISGDMLAFDMGNMIQDIVDVIGKAADLFADLFGKYLPQSEGMMGGIKTAFREVKNFFDDFKKSLLGLSDAARVVTDTFGPPIIALFKGLGDGLNYTANLALEDQDQWREWGETLTNVVDSILNLFGQFKNFISANLPIINGLFNAFASIIDVIAKGLEGLAAISRGNSALGGLLGLGAVLGVGGGLSALNARMGRTGKDRVGGRLGRGAATLFDTTKAGKDLADGLKSKAATVLNGTETKFDETGNKPYRRFGNNVFGGPTPGAPGTDAGQTMQNMTVRATTVYVNGPISGGGGRGRGGKGNPNQPSLFSSATQMPAYAISQTYGPDSPVKGPFQDELLMTGNVGRKGLGGMMGRIKPMAGRYGPGIGALGAQAMMLTSGNEAAAPFQMAGGMVSMYNPLLGLGISAAGTALTAETAAGGAISGAAAGAAIGTMIAPGVGTAIGAAVGTISGAIAGSINKGNLVERENRERGVSSGIYGAERTGRRLGLSGLTGLENQLKQERNNLRRAEDAMRSIYASTTMEEERDRYYEHYGLGDGAGESASQRVKDAGRELIIQDRIAAAKESGLLTGAEIEVLDSIAANNVAAEDAIRNYLDGLEETVEQNEIVARALGENYQTNVNFLKKATGKTEPEIKSLAATLGVDLTKSTQDASVLLKDFGITLAETVDEANSRMRGQMLENIESLFGERIKVLEAQEALDQATEEVYQNNGKFSSEKDMLNYVSLIGQQALSINPDDPFGQALKVEKVYGSPEGLAFQPGQQLEGRGSEMSPDFFANVGLLIQGMREGGILKAVENLTAFVGGTEAGKSGLQFDAEGAKAAISSLPLEQQAQIVQRLNSLSDTEKTSFEETLANERRSLGALGIDDEPWAAKRALSTFLEDLGLMGVTPGFDEVTTDREAEFSDEQKRIAEALRQGFNSVMEDPPEWWSGKPSWWNEKPAVYGVKLNDDGSIDNDDDPSTPQDTPTSRLARTMGRHNFYNSMLPGKRMVTSSLRNTNLGSLNSDHLTGNAYDLTGQNLVGYSNLVNQSGGFAEFHGSGFDRHLHVVPGATPMGDTMTPAAVMVSGGGGGSSTAYNITINAAQGQDPNAIAAAVMAKIDDRDRNMKERA
jgi:hypothetical protein